MKNKVFLLTVFLLLVGACASLHYFDLYIKPVANENLAKINKILKVENISTNQTFWYQRMVYRKSSYLVEYFPFKQWAKMPGELIKDTVISFYKNSFLFTKVIGENSSIEPDLVMKINIDSLEMLYEDKHWYAHLALDIEMVDFKTEKTYLSHYFNRKMRIKGKKARYIPEKISKILQEELVIIIKKLKK